MGIWKNQSAARLIVFSSRRNKLSLIVFFVVKTESVYNNAYLV